MMVHMKPSPQCQDIIVVQKYKIPLFIYLKTATRMNIDFKYKLENLSSCVIHVKQ